MSERRLTKAELDALAVLARGHRLIVLLVPVGVPEEDIKQLTRDTSAKLDELVAKRGPLT